MMTMKINDFEKNYKIVRDWVPNHFTVVAENGPGCGLSFDSVEKAEAYIRHIFDKKIAILKELEYPLECYELIKCESRG